MANKVQKTSKKQKTVTPAVRYLRYHLANSGSPGTETSHFIDLARDLSAVNRRLMRSGRVYHVKKITVVSSNTPSAPTGGRVSVSTIPDSWVARGAWNRAFKISKKQLKLVQENSGVRQGKWADFKVHMTGASYAATLAVPIDNDNNAVALGEWNYTTLTTPDGLTSADYFDLTMLGAHQGTAGSRTTVSLIQSYGETRTTVQAGPGTPSTASSDPLVNLFDDGTHFDEVMDVIEDENDNPPYDLTGYPGDNSNMPQAIVVQDGALSDGRVVFGGFSAICGHIEIECTSAVQSDVYSVLVELAPGSYRGIKADVI